MDINQVIAFFKKFLLLIFNNFGVTEEFEALGIDIVSLLSPAEETTQDA